MTLAHTTLHGLTAVTITPFAADGAVNIDELARLVGQLADDAVDAVTVNGNTGEFTSLTPSEADAIVETAVAAAAGRLPIVAAVGGPLPVAAAAASHAAASGAAMVMIHQPVHPYRSRIGWLEYHRAIAEAAGGLEIILYVRDETIDTHALQLLRDSCPAVSGIKYAVADPLRLQTLIAAHESLAWSCGLAEQWAPLFWAVGARGFTSGIANVAPELSRALLAALREGNQDLTRRLWSLAAPFEQLRSRHGGIANVSAIKEALRRDGLLASATVRPPLSPADDRLRAEVAGILERWSDFRSADRTSWARVT